MPKCKKPVKFTKNSGYVRCGQCKQCRKIRKLEISTKSYLEYMNQNYKAQFITLTYKPYFRPRREEFPEIRNSQGNLVTTGGSLDRKQFDRFIMRLRHHAKEMFGVNIRLQGVGEYGGLRKHPHYHLIVFGLPSKPQKLRDLINKTWVAKNPLTGEKEKLGRTEIKLLDPFQKYDLVQLKDVLPCIYYVSRYTIKKMTNQDDFKDGREPEFGTFSKNPSLGSPEKGNYTWRLFEKISRKKNILALGGLTTYEKWFIDNKLLLNYKEFKGYFKQNGYVLKLDRVLQEKLVDHVFPGLRKNIEKHLQERDYKYEKEFIKYKEKERLASRDEALLFDFTDEALMMHKKLEKEERREKLTKLEKGEKI